MKRFSLLMVMLFSVAGIKSVAGLKSEAGLKAQVASTICLDETREVFAGIDPGVLLNANSTVLLIYEHTYIMRMDPKQEEKSASEVRTYRKDFYRHDSPDQLVTGDAKETFTYRKFQNVIYQTNPSLEKAGLIPLATTELFDHCLVRECHFVPAPGRDSISYKRAFMTVDEAGQKKFQIKDLEFISNPHDWSLVSIRVNFTEKSLFKWSFFEFDQGDMGIGPVPAPSTAAEEFLGEGGALKDEFEGVSLKDYRR